MQVREEDEMVNQILLGRKEKEKDERNGERTFSLRKDEFELVENWLEMASITGSSELSRPQQDLRLRT